MKDLFDNYSEQPIYVAYGSNMEDAQMKHRCPQAQKIGSFYLPDYRLVFRGTADIEYSHGSQVPVVLWKITSRCEKSLNRYEGFPDIYTKDYWTAGDDAYLAYTMNRKKYAPPVKEYYELIKRGYKTAGFGFEKLDDAVAHAFRNRTGNGHVPQRYQAR